MGESLPLVWYEEIRMSENVYFRNSCWVLPAFRQTRIALLMCSPVAQARTSFGVALLAFMTKWKSCIATLPEPPPPPAPIEPEFVSPHDQEWSWISFLCVLSWASPSIPSIFKK